MSNEDRMREIVTRTVVYELPEMGPVAVLRDVDYGEAGGDLTFDLYRSPDAEPGYRAPAVIIVAGYPGHPGDPSRGGTSPVPGRRFKETGSSVSWARLIAASGLAAIAYTNHEPTGDLDALIDHLRRNAPALGIDENRVGLWASSGNVPLALSMLMRTDREYIRCAALLYGLTLDSEGSSVVAEAARAYGFSNPCEGKSTDGLRSDVPLFVARAGKDEFQGLNDALDRFVTGALSRNLPITVVNHPEGPHAFDLLHDSETTREIVRRTLAFLRLHLLERTPK